MEDIAKLKQEIEELKFRMGIGHNDPAKEGYIVLVSLLNQQNSYLKEINIKTLITDEAKGKTSEFERSKALWEKLPNMIENVSNLKAALKMEGEENKKKIEKALSAKDIANGNI